MFGGGGRFAANEFIGERIGCGPRFDVETEGTPGRGGIATREYFPQASRENPLRIALLDRVALSSSAF